MKGALYDWHPRGENCRVDMVDVQVVPVHLGGACSLGVSLTRHEDHETLQISLEADHAGDFARVMDTTGFGWIPVSDRLPDEGVGVLVCIQGIPSTRALGRWRAAVGWATFCDMGFPGGGVTHWRPLPLVPSSPVQTGD